MPRINKIKRKRGGKKEAAASGITHQVGPLASDVALPVPASSLEVSARQPEKIQRGGVGRREKKGKNSRGEKRAP